MERSAHEPAAPRALLALLMLATSCQSCAHPKPRTFCAYPQPRNEDRMFGARTIETTGLGVTFDSQMLMFEIFAAVSRDGHLATVQFYERQQGMEGIKALTTTNWDLPVPAEASVWAATGGVMTGAAQQYWVGWISGRRLAALALTQERPIFHDLVDGETLIAPPLLMPDGSLHQFAWRPAQTAGKMGGQALWRHVFHGALHAQANVQSARLAEIDGPPAIASIAEPVPGPAMMGPSIEFVGSGKRVVLGWVQATGAGMRMSVATVDGDDVHVTSSSPVAGITPLDRQRPGLRVDLDGTVELAAMGERPGPHPSYFALRMPVVPGQSTSEPSDGFRTSRDGLGPAKLDLPRREKSTSEPSDGFRTSRDGLGPAKLDLPRRESTPAAVQDEVFSIGGMKILGAAAHYLRDTTASKDPLWYAVSEYGALLRRGRDHRPPQLTRKGVPPNYPFPFVVSAGRVYEAFPTSDGGIDMRGYGEGEGEGQ